MGVTALSLRDVAAALVMLTGCGPSSPARDPQPPRPGTVEDVVQAAVTEAPRAALLLPLEAARTDADLGQAWSTTPGSAARPQTPHPPSLCDRIGDPNIDERVARFVQDRPGASSGSWRLVLAGPLVQPAPGPLATQRRPRAMKPVRLVVQSTARIDRIDVVVEAGGWLLCALPSIQLIVDGKPLQQLYGKPANPGTASLDLGVQVTGNGARLSLELPAELLRIISSAATFEMAWKGGRVVLQPQKHDAVRALAAHLAQMGEPAVLPFYGAGGSPG